MSNRTQTQHVSDEFDDIPGTEDLTPPTKEISDFKRLLYKVTHHFSIGMFFVCAFLGFLAGWLQNWQLELYYKHYQEVIHRDCGTTYIHPGLWNLPEIKEIDHQMMAYWASAIKHLVLALTTRHYVYHKKDPFDWNWHMKNKALGGIHLSVHGFVFILSLVRHVMQIASYFNLPDGTSLGFAGSICFMIFLVQSIYYVGWTIYGIVYHIQQKRLRSSVSTA